MKDKIIEILEKYGVDFNMPVKGKQYLNNIATRIASLYTPEISEEEISEDDIWKIADRVCARDVGVDWDSFVHGFKAALKELNIKKI